MKVLGDILQLTNQFLKQKGNTSHRRVSEQILSHVLGVNRIDLYLQYDRPLNETEIAKAREILKKVVEGYPIEYVTGYVDFLGCSITIDRRVIIPRPETEIMAHSAIQAIKSLSKPEMRVLDLCCGSGCLGLSIKKEVPAAKVTLSDISTDALEIAKHNAKVNELCVEFVESDLLEKIDSTYDVVVCNPPYISEEAYQALDRSVRDWEPKKALCPGKLGTEIYARLAQELPRILKEASKVFFEIGFDQKEAIEKIFDSRFYEMTIKNDWAHLPRFVEIIYHENGFKEGEAQVYD